MNEEQANRIIQILERIADALEKQNVGIDEPPYKKAIRLLADRKQNHKAQQIDQA